MNIKKEQVYLNEILRGVNALEKLTGEQIEVLYPEFMDGVWENFDKKNCHALKASNYILFSLIQEAQETRNAIMES